MVEPIEDFHESRLWCGFQEGSGIQGNGDQILPSKKEDENGMGKPKSSAVEAADEE